MRSLLLLSLLSVLSLLGGVAGELCVTSEQQRADRLRRTLSIVSFDTRGAAFHEKKMRLYSQNFGAGVRDVVMLGRNVSWNPLKFFNKPLHYAMWLNDTLRTFLEEGKEPNDAYVMLLDSDTIINARPIEQLWEKFDCARKGKPILMGSETSCWYGLQCKKRHIERFYEPIGETMNVFINSGYILGTLPALQEMFAFIGNNNDYFRKIVYWVHWFCDQSAYTYYYGHNRDKIQIDENQQVFGTLSSFVEGGRKNVQVCRSQFSNEIVRNCSESIYPQKSFSIDEKTCILSKNISYIREKHMSVLEPHYTTLSKDPIVFHGNAKGKVNTKYLSTMIKKCMENKMLTSE